MKLLTTEKLSLIQDPDVKGKFLGIKDKLTLHSPCEKLHMYMIQKV